MWGPVRTYPDILNPQLFLSGYGFRPHASGEFGGENGYFSIHSPEWKKKKRNIRKESDVWTVNPDIFESDDVAKSCLVFYRTINQLGGTSCRPSFLRMNRDTSGCVSTGIWFEFLNPERKSCGLENIRIRVDGTWDDNPVLSYCLRKPGRLLEKGVSQIIPC